jgi:tetratricopeptide (TPR) repeat protein
VLLVCCRHDNKKATKIKPAITGGENVAFNKKEDAVFVTQKNTEYPKISGVYLLKALEEINCPFWITIQNKNDSLYYSFFKENKIVKKGILIKSKNNGDVYLNFSKEFTGIYSKNEITIQNYGNSTNEYERIPYCDLKYLNLVKNEKITVSNLEYYNDKGYYLEQSGLYKEAIYLLEKIIENFPDRTVAYINLGDAYWGLGKKEHAKKAYLVYVEQMTSKNKKEKIGSSPKVVCEMR